MKHVKVLIGNYGSGKSELALNFAMQAAARGDRTELLDLDMVNTYFRLTERGKLVEQKEIRLVSPNFACSGIETLSLPAEVSSAFVLDWDTVIFDVGGDDVGATGAGPVSPGLCGPGARCAGGAECGEYPAAFGRHSGEASPFTGGYADPRAAADHRYDQQHKPRHCYHRARPVGWLPDAP